MLTLNTPLLALCYLEMALKLHFQNFQLTFLVRNVKVVNRNDGTLHEMLEK